MILILSKVMKFAARNRPVAYFIFGTVLLSLQACTLFSYPKLQSSSVGVQHPVFDPDGKTVKRVPGDATVFSWDATRSATMINSSGFACFQIAELASNTQNQVAAQAVTGALSAISRGDVTDPDEIRFARNAATQTVLASERDRINTFMNVSLFHLCMINANGGISRDSMSVMFREVLNTAAQIEVARVTAAAFETGQSRRGATAEQVAFIDLIEGLMSQAGISDPDETPDPDETSSERETP